MFKTKIVCTLGPASSSETILRKMMRAGMSLARINFSHGDLEAHLAKIKIVRALNKRYRRRLNLLGDLEGPRIRVGKLPKGEGLPLAKGKTLWLTQRPSSASDNAVSFDYEGSLSPIRPGQSIYIDDGTIALMVVVKEKRRLKTRVVVGGILKEHKGINIPGARLLFERVSEKDKLNIRFSADHKLDFIAQSFVRTASDVHAVREYLASYGGRCQVIAKIETREGIKHIDSIIAASDGIMIARGDMGVSVPIYEIPIIQKQIIKKCNHAKKSVITATQMLESMTENRIPTRAEVTDVANAIIDGTDYVMLSAESAAGKYPVEAVSMMKGIIAFTETYLKKEHKGMGGLGL